MPTFPNSTDLPASGLRRAGAVPMSQAGGKNETTLGDLADWLNPAGPTRATSLAEDGFKADLDPATGLSVGGGTPTDNAAVLNAAVGAATALAPVDLILDGAGVGLAKALSVPGGVGVGTKVRGLGPGATILYALAGSNANVIQSAAVGDTDASRYAAWYPGGPQGGAAGPFHLSDLTVHGNHGTFPGGNSNGAADGSLSAPSAAGDARGPYANDATRTLWLVGLWLVGHDGVTIENVEFLDAPAYSALFSACRNGTIRGCTFRQTVPDRLNTDANHFNGGCSNWRVLGNHYANIADDCHAVNLDEGDATGGTTFVFGGNTYENCNTALRVYGYAAHASHVQLLGATGKFKVGLGIIGTAVGNPVNGLPDASHQVTFDGFDVELLDHASYLVNQIQNAGHVTVRGRVAVGGSTPLPVYQLAAGAASFVDLDVTVQRSDYTGAAGCVAVASNPGNDFGHAGTMRVRFCSVSQFGKTYTPLPALMSLTGVQSVERLILEAIDAPDTPTVLAVAGSAYVRRVGGADAAKAGPISDAQALPGTHYQSADLGGPAWKDGSGNVFDYTTATLKPKVESVQDRLWAAYHCGSLLDSSGYNRHMAALGGGPSFAAGKFGNGALFNGTSQGATIPNADLTAYGLPDYRFKFGTTPWEIVGWVKPTGVAGTKILLSNWDTDTSGDPNGYAFLFYKVGADLKLSTFPVGGSQVDLTKAGALAAGTWLWFSARYTGTNLELDVNDSGTPASAAVAAIPAAVGKTMYVARDPSDNLWGDVLLDELYFFNRGCLTAGERTAKFAATAPTL